MKKFFLLITVMAFMVAAPLAMAAKEDKINCCIKGKCSKMTTAKCDKAKGEVVKDCKDCKKPAKSK